MVNEIKRKTAALSSATDLILKIISIGTSMKQEQIHTLRASVTPHINDDIEEVCLQNHREYLISYLYHLFSRVGKNGPKLR